MPAGVAIGLMPGYLVGAHFVLYLSAVIVVVCPRTWQAEDEHHYQDVGKHR